MGTYMDFFIALPEEAMAIVESEDPFEDWPSYSIRGISDIDLEVLWGVIDGDKPSEATDLVSSEPVIEDPEEELFFYRVDDRFVEALSRISAEEVENYSIEWVKKQPRPDRPRKGWQPVEQDVAKVIIKELSEFARQAKSLNKPILEWANY